MSDNRGGEIMAKHRLRDFIVLLPGITGSVLQKDGKDVWAISGQTLWNAVTGSMVDKLILENDDPDADDIGDEIRATRIMPDVHFVPGLWKIDGYSATSRMITDNFILEVGHPDSDKPANFYEFPYDWRRDNRVAARKLKKLIDRQLPKWREHSLEKDAKVILVAHSMGGLISRYYLEVLEGWRNCKALITFGTPYRGSVNALDYLANGYKKLFLDLTEAMRSFTSIYELLPIYPCLEVDGRQLRVAEFDRIPEKIDCGRAEQALKFHRDIEEAVNNHQQDVDYLKNGYKILPIVGTRQPTLQSAIFEEGKLTASRRLLPGISKILEDGDGTVPRLSAIPIEMSEEYRDTYVPERHGSLQTNESVLADLLGRVQQMQVTGLGKIRGPEIRPKAAELSAISLDLDDIYVAGEPVELRARLVNVAEQRDYGALQAHIQAIHGTMSPMIPEFQEAAEGWSLRLEGLPSGLYRVEVRTAKGGPGSPPAVHDVFEIAG
jgi:hypothetical protein